MRSTFAVLAAATALVSGAFVAQLSGSTGPIPLNCDRACLEGVVDQYLKAVVAHRHSIFTFSKPRSKNCRRPNTAFRMPKGVSAMRGRSL